MVMMRALGRFTEVTFSNTRGEPIWEFSHSHILTRRLPHFYLSVKLASDWPPVSASDKFLRPF